MASPTHQGGDDSARERRESQQHRAEQAEAEAQFDAPEPEPIAPQEREPEPERTPEPEPTDAEKRLAAMDARAARVERSRERGDPDERSSVERPRDERGRFASAAESETEQDETGVEAEAEPSAAPEVPAAPTLPPGTRLGEDGQWYVDFKVDGEPRSLPFEQYHANAQKYLTGDQRLQQAALERKQLEALRAPQGPQPPSGAGVNGLPQGGQQGITREQLEKAFVEGDEQAQTALLERLNREQPQYDPQVIATSAAMQAREQIEVENAIAQVSNDPVNAMILGDDVMRDVANRYSESLRTSEPHLRPAENIARALELTRQHVARYAPAPAPPPAATASLESRTAAKAAHATHNVSSGGQARQPLAPPAPPQGRNTRSIVEEMRLARGLG